MQTSPLTITIDGAEQQGSILLVNSYAGTYYIVIKDNTSNVVGIGKFIPIEVGGSSTGIDPDTPPE